MKWKISYQHHGMLIRDYLQKIHAFSRRMTKVVKFEGGIFVNNMPEKVGYRLAAGDVLSIQFPPEERGLHMHPANVPLSIIYEDDDIIIINKAAGMAVVPSYRYTTSTVANGLLAHYEKQQIPYTVHIVTRLDRDTSGLLLVAKHRYSHSLLAVSQNKGEIVRKYQAIVEGQLREKEGTIAQPIGRKADSMIERAVIETGKHAVTNYQIISESADVSLAAVELETGRTHQIRVHFSWLGHPLAGDTLYGGSAEKIGRQALHCDTLCFEHPATKERMSFQLPLPCDMEEMLAELNQKK